MHKVQLVLIRCLLLLLFLTACAVVPGNSHEGECRVNPPSDPVFCTMQYDPVCGCDGKTYGNACTARGAGISDSTPGACDDTGAR